MRMILFLLVLYLIADNYTPDQIGTAVFKTGSTLQEIGEDISNVPVKKSIPSGVPETPKSTPQFLDEA